MLGTNIVGSIPPGSSTWSGYPGPLLLEINEMTTPQVIDMIRIHHPNIGYKVAASMLTLAQHAFVVDSKIAIKTSTISLANQTVVGTSASAPLTLTDTASTYTWDFYRDTNVPTLTLKTDSSVVFMFLRMLTLDSTGAIISRYSIQINQDATVSFYDQYGTKLDDFQRDATTMIIYFVKVPDTLAVSSTPEQPQEFMEALVDHVVAAYYPSRTDYPTVERLQLAKHFQNRYDMWVAKAKKVFNAQFSYIPVTSDAADEFQRDTLL